MPRKSFSRGKPRRSNPLAPEVEARLVRQLQSGSEEQKRAAREELVVAHLPMIKRMTLEYKDVGSMVMLRLLDPAYKGFSSYTAQEEGSVTAWISGVVGNLLLKEHGRNRQDIVRYEPLQSTQQNDNAVPVAESYEDSLASPTLGPAEVVHGRKMGSALAQAFMTLTPKQQRVLELSAAGSDGVEIAATLGLAGRAPVNKCLTRAVAALQEHPALRPYIEEMKR